LAAGHRLDAFLIRDAADDVVRGYGREQLTDKEGEALTLKSQSFVPLPAVLF
jgi:hypothetical protein